MGIRVSSWLLTPFLLLLSVVHLAIWGGLGLTATISLVKLEWTAWAVVGAVFSAWFLYDVAVDFAELRRSRLNGDARDTVEIFVLIGAVLLGMHLLLGSIGVISMTRPLPVQRAVADAGLQAAFVVAGEGLVLMLIRINGLRRRLNSGGRT